MRLAWNSFSSSSRVTKCTTYYSWASCSGITSIIGAMTSPGVFSCKSWDVNDYKAGAAEIARSCANACEMLQWYSSWWKNYRVGRYVGAVVPNVYDGLAYVWYQDYCGTGAVRDTSSQVYGGVTSSVTMSSNSYARHPKCWPGYQIPLCRSFAIATRTTC